MVLSPIKFHELEQPIIIITIDMLIRPLLKCASPAWAPILNLFRIKLNTSQALWTKHGNMSNRYSMSKNWLSTLNIHVVDDSSIWYLWYTVFKHVLYDFKTICDINRNVVILLGFRIANQSTASLIDIWTQSHNISN